MACPCSHLVVCPSASSSWVSFAPDFASLAVLVGFSTYLCCVREHIGLFWSTPGLASQAVLVLRALVNFVPEFAPSCHARVGSTGHHHSGRARAGISSLFSKRWVAACQCSKHIFSAQPSDFFPCPGALPSFLCTFEYQKLKISFDPSMEDVILVS
mmetsp:Transcript_139651/g.446882  ORF Transcript_139651/g.446882 Transcript_139651/m.446882 type:complete len:156 (+) Transcript_139651:829-1296(+)